MKKNKIITLILHSLIFIGVGHAPSILLVFDIISIPTILINGLEKSFSNDFRHQALVAGLFSVIGKGIILSGLFLKKERSKNVSAIIGLSLLYVSFGILVYGDWSYDFIHGLSFFTGIPFLIASGILISRLLKTRKES